MTRVTPRPRWPRSMAAVLVGLALAGCASAGATPSPSSTQAAVVPPVATVAPSSAPSGPTPVVVDTDLSSDDAMAVPFLVRDPSLDVRAVNVSGTGLVHCTQGIQFATDLLAALGRTGIPVACGPETALGAGHEFPADWRARADGEYGLSIPRVPASVPDATATERLQAVVKVAGRPVTIVATGPMTNIAQALRDDPSLSKGIERIVAMGGAVDTGGNVDLGNGTLLAEWNVFADPVAWRGVLHSGIPITLVPLDATRWAPVNQAFIDTLATDHAAAPADIAYELLLRGGLTIYDQLWDPLTAVVAVDPAVATFETMPLDVVTQDGGDLGRTVRSPTGTPVEVATKADQAAFEARFLEGLRAGAARAKPFNPVGTMTLRFDGTACTFERPETVTPGSWLLDSASTSTTGAATAVIRLHAGYGEKDLEAYVKTASDPTAQPPFSDLVGLAVFETPGTNVQVIDISPGNYHATCLTPVKPVTPVNAFFAVGA